MSNRHVICIAVDGLRAGALGAYGNTISATPQLDALASRALVADWLLLDSPSLQGFYRSAWQGLHALRPEDAEKSVLDCLHQAGVQQRLVTDDPWMMERADQLPFDEALLFDNDAEEAAGEIESTALGRFFAEAIEGLHQWREDVSSDSGLMWLHSRGMFGPWDAPLGLRADLLDDEDPLGVPEFVQPPAELCEVDDPDVILEHRIAYAAQIAVLDACVGAFVAAVEEEFVDSETLVVLVGSQGFALGEHGSIGTKCNELYSERLHVPLLMYPCGTQTPLLRLPGLAHPADVGATLVDWLGQDGGNPVLSDGISFASGLVGGECQLRQLAVAVGSDSERVVRTPAWMLRREEADSVQLYTKPDDQWEFNDVAGLCPDEVEQLQEELASFERCCREKQRLPMAPENEGLIVASR